MPSATLDAIALRSTNPFKRAMDVSCVILLQLLTRVVLATEQDLGKYRNHPAFGPCSILARLDAGETFDLPPLLIASIRAIVAKLRCNPRLGDSGVARSGAPLPGPVQNPARRHRAARLTGSAPLGAMRSPRHVTTPPGGHRGAFKTIAAVLPHPATPISLRHRNEHLPEPPRDKCLLPPAGRLPSPGLACCRLVCRRHGC